MDEVTRHHALRQRIASQRLEREGRIGQALDIGLADLEGLVIDHLLVLDQAAPDAGQDAEHLGVAVTLDEPFRRHGMKWRLQARKTREQVVEGTVLCEDDHDRLDIIAQGFVRDGWGTVGFFGRTGLGVRFHRQGGEQPRKA